MALRRAQRQAVPRTAGRTALRAGKRRSGAAGTQDGKCARRFVQRRADPRNCRGMDCLRRGMGGRATRFSGSRLHMH